MTEYLPTLTPEEDLSGTDKALNTEQRLSKAHHSATRIVVDAHREEFHRAKADAAAALNIRWTPRKSAKEKALEEIEELLAKYPELRVKVAAPLDEVNEDARPLLEGESRPATAEVLGVTRSGRLTADHKVFVYLVDGAAVRTDRFVLITVDGREV